MGRDEFAAAVVAAVDHAVPDGFEGDSSFVVVHRRAAGDVVHVGVMNARQGRELPRDARRAQRGDQLADLDGACFYYDQAWSAGRTLAG